MAQSVGSTRSALMKVMISRYMRRHGIKDEPDQSTPGYYTADVCNHPCGDQAFRVSLIIGEKGRLLTSEYNLFIINRHIFVKKQDFLLF